MFHVPLTSYNHHKIYDFQSFIQQIIPSLHYIQRLYYKKIEKNQLTFAWCKLKRKRQETKKNSKATLSLKFSFFFSKSNTKSLTTSHQTITPTSSEKQVTTIKFNY